MRSIRVFAVDVELYESKRWVQWSTVHVVAPTLETAAKKAVRIEREANGMKWRASGVRFVCEASQ